MAARKGRGRVTVVVSVPLPGLIRVPEVGEGMRMGTGDDGQALRCGDLLCCLPVIAFSRQGQRIQLGLVGGEGGPELSFVHRDAYRV